MSNPQTAILGQLLGYPAAFTNTILKAMAKQTVRNPETFLTQHLPAAAIMTGVAVLTNGIRSNGESFEKEPHEIIRDGLVRWGGNGLPADMWMRGRDAARMYQNPLGWLSGLGPAQGDIFKLIATGNIFSVGAGKIPGTGAFKAVFEPFELTEDFPEWWRETQRKFDRWGREIVVPEKDRVPSRPFKKGGEVFNVPQVPVEPDERIDKMTGLPYNIQAGGAFIDQEDRQEFVVGGITRGLTALGKAATKRSTNIIKGLYHGSPHNFPTLKADKAIDSNALQLGRGVAATTDKKKATAFLEVTPDPSVGRSEKVRLEERTARGSSTPTLYELEAHIDEGEIIRTGTILKDQPSEIQNKIEAIEKDFDIKLSESDKASKRIFYILKKKIEDKQDIHLTAEDIFRKYGIKASKRDLRGTSLEGLSKGGDVEYSFFDDSVLEIVAKITETGGPRNLIKGGRSSIKKAKEADMEVDRILYQGTGEEWAERGTMFDDRYFLDDYMDADKPWNHMTYLSTDKDIATFYARKRWNSEQEFAERTGGKKPKKDYWENPEIIPVFVKGPGLKLDLTRWSPSTYRRIKNESPDLKALPWGIWFRQDAWHKLGIKKQVAGERAQIKEIWKEAKKQGYGYIEFINAEDISGHSESTTQAQIIPLSRDKVRSIYADFNKKFTDDPEVRDLWSAEGGKVIRSLQRTRKLRSI